jgi:hypothetical protein
MRPVADPVSWLMIRPGWKVYSSDEVEVGAVDEVTGDDSLDIFDGLAVATSALGQPRYIPAERVAGIVEGRVHLSLTSEQVAALGEYLEPATSAEIEPDDRGGVVATAEADVREVEGKIVAPVRRHEHPMNFWQRLYLLLRRRT